MEIQRLLTAYLLFLSGKPQQNIDIEGHHPQRMLHLTKALIRHMYNEGFAQKGTGQFGANAGTIK